MGLQKATIQSKKNLTEDIFELILKPQEPLAYEAGQFITIKINDGQKTPCFRAYSIASAPNTPLTLCIKLMQDGRGSNWLHQLKPAQEIEFLGPNGKLTFQNQSSPSYFIATGTGIAPLKSMIEDQLKKGNKSSIQLIFGVRYISGVFYENQLKSLTASHPNFSYKIAISQPESPNNPHLTGRVTDHLKNLDPKAQYYLCGLSPMINSVSEILTKQGVPTDAIHFEKYD
ncbi:hypothetical protein KJ632_01385 [Patescibacteria group bacterium]|nr:hypothetical protein [Patescibacteria group bacterium]